MLGEAAYHISESQLKHEAPSLRAPCPSLADSERRLREACSCTAQPAGSRACEGWLERRLGQSAANIGPPGHTCRQPQWLGRSRSQGWATNRQVHGGHENHSEYWGLEETEFVTASQTGTGSCTLCLPTKLIRTRPMTVGAELVQLVWLLFRLKRVEAAAISRASKRLRFGNHDVSTGV